MTVQFVFATTVALATTTMIAGAEEITLANGDTINVTILEHRDGSILVQHDMLGELTLTADQLKGGTIVDPVDATDMAQDSAPPVPEEKEWKSSFELGAGASFGNTDEQNFFAAVHSAREDEKTRTALDAAYYFGSSDGDRTENKFTAGILQDWFVPDSKWLYFAAGRLDYDEFQSWEYRLGMHGGAGYQWIKRDDLEITLRAGAGVIKEFNSADEDLRPEGLLGADLAWQISERQSLVASTTLYPDLGDMGEFRWINSAGWSALIDDEYGMSLNVSLLHEYQSVVDPGVEENDFRIVAGLKFDF